MSTFTLGVSGWGVLAPMGTGADDFGAGLRSGREPAVDAGEVTAAPMPQERVFGLPGFTARDHLGRKGTSFLDRRTALALIAGAQALDDSELVVDDDNRERVGVVLGTSAGSLQSTSDYTRETFEADKPYLVNPILFPNTVLNCAAGQVAIRYGLRGPNTTVAGGATAMLSALRWAYVMMRRGRAEALLVGAVEELTPHQAWTSAALGTADGVPAGEGCAMFMIENAAAMRAAGRRPRAEIRAVELAHTTEGTDTADALAAVIRRVLDTAGPELTVDTVITCDAAGEAPALDRAVGRAAERIAVTPVAGDAPAAAGALQLAVLLAGASGHSRTALITACTPDGAVGAAVVTV
ncbi:beta-ketoacyl synthase N-terminal-like domain-containing protein [Actinoplanes sp. NEAU-A12]|uniref:Beta-ketoacyl synthase N-terminal-like domain-containing protein n=1 Tax=Actinoplanes sandaracinus TaxID=3045177 RepID=A0ABT6WHS1_9ACTN|nr:beta-ketoacyl synthase N-terminal-like domain-containing protein [Actinoplanes sandaracinus]MDI6099265.1 beta-ketoacyl synthase N-terminal-like domain-containing protein [Actinoplanes sandaracinus]